MLKWQLLNHCIHPITLRGVDATARPGERPGLGMRARQRGTGAPMNGIMSDHRPVRVTLAHECELVTRGLQEMLARYSARVEFVPPQPDGTPAGDVDVTLHDSLAAMQLGPASSPPPSFPHAGRLVTYTWNPRPDLVDLALAHGSHGCLSKNLPSPTLVAALEAIHRGEVVVECGHRGARPRSSVDTPLTPREAEIITLITRGFDNFSIAREASLSINSVKTYIRTAYRKMGVSSRSQAVLWGVRHGYLDEVPASSDALTG